jgi:TonB family protein
MRIHRTTCFAAVVFALTSFYFVLAQALGVETGQAAYVGGSLPVPEATIGSFDATSPTVLQFKYTVGGVTGSGVLIPYRRISYFEYRTEVAHHIGVAPAIAVSLVKHRELKHFFSIRFSDSQDQVQVGVFEVAKHDSDPLLQVLRARAPWACRSPQATCGVNSAKAVFVNGSATGGASGAGVTFPPERAAGPADPTTARGSQSQQDSTKPTIEHSVEPTFGDCNKLKHGRVVTTLDALVGADGLPGEIKILSSSGDSCLDERAVAAVKQYRFHPATENGKPVSAHVTIAISFERL